MGRKHSPRVLSVGYTESTGIGVQAGLPLINKLVLHVTFLVPWASTERLFMSNMFLLQVSFGKGLHVMFHSVPYFSTVPGR